MHKEFRAQWIKAGYPHGSDSMGSAEVCKPPPDDCARVYHFLSSQHALTSIALKRLKVSRVSDVNDPFELLGLWLNDKKDRLRMREMKAEFDKKKGLLCFSGNWTSPVLWSHYADRHRGICLGFDLKKSIRQEVTYEDKRIRSAIGDDLDNPKLTPKLEKLLQSTKFAHWSYELESRVFVKLSEAKPEGPLYFRYFSKYLALREVILGANCELPLEELRDVVSGQYPDAVTFKARLAMKSFHIVPKESTVP